MDDEHNFANMWLEYKFLASVFAVFVDQFFER